MKIKFLLSFSLFSIIFYFSFGQSVDSLSTRKSNKIINLSGEFADVFNFQKMNFDSLKNDCFLYFGSSRCTPCRIELPSVIKIAQHYRQVNFVYITYDDSLTIKNELTQILEPHYLLPLNFYVFHMDLVDINKNRLAFGYPTKYFINKDKRICSFSVGGSSDVSKKEEGYSRLESMIKAK